MRKRLFTSGLTVATPAPVHPRHDPHPLVKTTDVCRRQPAPVDTLAREGHGVN